MPYKFSYFSPLIVYIKNLLSNKSYGVAIKQLLGLIEAGQLLYEYRSSDLI